MNVVTFRRRAVLALVLVLATAGTAYGVRALTGPECSVRLDDGSDVGLSRTDAMAVTSAVARGRRPTSYPTASDQELVDALTAGRPALSCTGNRPELPPQRTGPSGLTPRAGRVLHEMRAAFGDLPVGGFSPQGVRSGHIEGSAHYEGRAVDVFFRPVSERSRRRGWVLAQWAVAHAERLRLATVIYDERIWSARWPLDRWRTYSHPDGATDNPVLLHHDHVHLDVPG